jgi:hypothetical protein
MFQRTSPTRLTLIVLALILGILIGLAFLPAGQASGAQLAFSCANVDQIPLAECEALEDLYNSTDGDNWDNNNTWLVSNTPCTSWVGITCISGNVWQIELIGNLLTGPLPPSIGDLSELRILDLGQNQITGTLPSQIGLLTNLNRLDLNNNQITGTIPIELTTLNQLRDLSFAYNDLNGEIPSQMGQMTALQTIELVSNTLGGPIPSQLGDLSLLDYLDVGGNMLTGTIPIELGQPLNLATLYVEGNQLEGQIPEQLCNNVAIATFSYNKLEPVMPDSCLNTELATDAWDGNQTRPPTELVANSFAVGEVQLDWTIVDYLDDPGYYQILSSETSGGPYTLQAETADKTIDTFTLTGLDPTTELFFVVRTVTLPHAGNQNELVSVNSLESPATPTALTLVDFQAVQPTPYIALPLAAAFIILSFGAFILFLRRGW